MNTPYILITLVVVAIILVPILYSNTLQKKKAKKKLAEFSDLAKQRNLNLDFSEAMPNLFIGLDGTSRKLMTLEGENAEREQILDLLELSSCKVQIDKTDGSGGINQISLNLRSTANGNPEIVFYNETLEVHPDAERRLQVAEKWEKIITANLGR